MTAHTSHTTRSAGPAGAAAQPADAPPIGPPQPTATARSARSASTASAGRPLPDDARRVLGLCVPVIVRLAHRSMPMGEIMRLSPGTLIEFDKPGHLDLELMIGNRVIGRGHAVKVGENFGLRIKAIGPVRERIRSLGSNSA